MDFFYWLGLLFLMYYIISILLILLSDCDIKMKYAEKFGKPIDSLRENVIWITGASSGIGEHLAMSCAKVGSKLILSARRKAELERVKENCLAISNGKLNTDDVMVLPLDISDSTKHKKLFDDVISHFGKLDILVNNAGRSQRALWENIELEVDRSMFELNVFGLINLSRIAVKYFLNRGKGHIAVTSSGAGLMGVPFSATYTATKHALHGYFNCLRAENLFTNLTVTIFCPGPTFTNFLQECYTENKDKKFGETTNSNDKRMTGERCGHLFAVALANKIDEAWVAISPILPLYYLNSYFPFILKSIFKILGEKALLKLRDSRESIKIN